MNSDPIVDPPPFPFSDRHYTRMVPQAQQFLAGSLRPGDLAVDLTAGNGGDTLFLFRCVGSRGRVLAFDIQPEALARTRARLSATDAALHCPSCREHPANLSSPGVYLLHDSHAALDRYLGQAPQGIIANLGYLPGGDREVTTEPPSTLAALGIACDRLAVGGRLAVVLYVAHPGGAEESRCVERFFAALPTAGWRVLTVKVGNRPEAPFLLTAEKR